MLAISLIALAVASISAFLSLNTKEDVVKAAMACVAIIFAFLTLILAPWPLKLIIVAIPLMVERIYNRSTEKLN